VAVAETRQHTAKYLERLQAQKVTLLKWVKRYYADSVVCLNDLCNGSQQKLRNNMAKVALLVQSIDDADGILSEQEITDLYGHLQCLIDLKVDITIEN